MCSSEQLPGQMTVEECIADAEKPTLQQVMEEWEREQAEAEPVYGGF